MMQVVTFPAAAVLGRRPLRKDSSGLPFLPTRSLLRARLEGMSNES